MSREQMKERPRISIDITQEQHDKLSSLVPWGLKAVLFRTLVDGLIALMEEKGDMVLAAILKKKLDVENILNLGIKRKE